MVKNGCTDKEVWVIEGEYEESGFDTIIIHSGTKSTKKEIENEGLRRGMSEVFNVTKLPLKMRCKTNAQIKDWLSKKRA